jgi:hypothetical protein
VAAAGLLILAALASPGLAWGKVAAVPPDEDPAGVSVDATEEPEGDPRAPPGELEPGEVEHEEGWLEKQKAVVEENLGGLVSAFDLFFDKNRKLDLEAPSGVGDPTHGSRLITFAMVTEDLLVQEPTGARRSPSRSPSGSPRRPWTLESTNSAPARRQKPANRAVGKRWVSKIGSTAWSITPPGLRSVCQRRVRGRYPALSDEKALIVRDWRQSEGAPALLARHEGYVIREDSPPPWRQPGASHEGLAAPPEVPLAGHRPNTPTCSQTGPSP